MRVVPVEEPQKYGVVVGVTEQPAPAGVVVGVVTEQPGPSSGVVDQTLAMLDGLADEGGRGSLESLGRWNEKRSIFGASILGMCSDRAMPIKLEAKGDAETMVRVAFGKLVDELVQTNASSGILAISTWEEIRGSENHRYGVTVWGFAWAASPDDVSYQRHGFVGMQSKQRQNIRFANFEGVVDDFGDEDQIAVYRVTLPSRGLDPDKWVGRPPPPAPEELYTGPRSDELVCTEEISGDYSAACACVHGLPVSCNSMTVVPLGADTIETWRTGCVFFPPFIGPTAEGAARTRNPGTNAFLNPQNPDPNCNLMTFSAEGTAKQGCCCGHKKRRTSQKRTFHKVNTRDLAGKWCGCGCSPCPYLWPFTSFFCTKKKALNEDQYEESGLNCCLALPLPCRVDSTTRTRKYVNGHPTNGFVRDGGKPDDPCAPIHWYRDPGCAGGSDGGPFFLKKVG